MAKISRPILRRICLRHRLFEQLDNLRNLPVTWVSAPAGSGKTTLLGSYIENRKIPCLWYQLDGSDGDIATFFYYMGQAAAKAAPRRRKPLPLLTPEYLLGIPTFTRRYFEELYSRLKTPSLVVFDNYQEVPDESPLHEIIHIALSLIPGGMNAVVMSRKDMPSAFIRLKANQHIDFLRWESIRLTEEETGEIVTRRAKEISSPEMIHYLHGMSDGWAAGLVLISEAVKRDRMALQFIGKNTLQEVFVYFAREVFENLDRKTQEVLLATAFLPKMTVRMAEEITGDPLSGEILDYMNRNNYFITKHFGDEPVYEYHPLCRDFLQEHAGKLLTPDTLSQIQRSAAGILERAGQTESAVSILKNIRDWEGMAGIIISHAPDMIKQGRYGPLREWLDSLPDEVVEGNPSLLYWKGLSILSSAPLTAKSCFEQAFAGFQTGNDLIGASMAAAGAIFAVFFSFSETTEFHHWFSVVLDLTAKVGPLPSEEAEATIIASMFLAAAYLHVHNPEVETWERRLLEMPETPATIRLKFPALRTLFWHRLMNKSTNEALPLLGRLERLCRPPHAEPLNSVVFHSAEVQYYLFTGLHDELMEAARSGLELSRKTGIHIEDVWFYLHALVSFLNVMDCKGAEAWIEKMPPVESMPVWTRCLCHISLARLALIRGDLEHALYEARQGVSYIIGGDPIHSLAAHLMLSQVFHHMGNHEEAQQELAQARSYCDRNIRSHFSIQLLVEAQFAFDAGDEDGGVRLLRETLTLAREGGYVFGLFDIPSETLRMCEKALDAGIEVEHVKTIIRRRGLIPDTPPVHIENWPWAVRIYALGRFEIVRDDQPIRHSRKTQHRPMLLLKAIVALGGRGISEEHITDLLWPDAEGDMAHQSFETTLHRLRRLLGNTDAISLADGKLSLDNRYCWADIWAFEHLLRQAEELQKEGDRDRARELVEKAITLYQGKFLAGDSEVPWMTPASERLRSKFVKGINWLGDYFETAGNWDTAAGYYERYIDLDGSLEEMYRRLMVCYRNLGRRSEALSVYQRCRKTLTSILGAKPSRETEAIHASIISQRIS